MWPQVQEVRDFGHWDKPDFLLAFMVASLMGTVLQYSTFVCTAVNSALTTTVVGCVEHGSQPCACETKGRRVCRGRVLVREYPLR